MNGRRDQTAAAQGDGHAHVNARARAERVAAAGRPAGGAGVVDLGLEEARGLLGRGGGLARSASRGSSR